MDVRRLSISQETQKKLMGAHVLTNKQKRRIRLNGVKELLESKPKSHHHMTRELVFAAGYRSDQMESGYNFIYNLVKSGVLIRQPIPGSQKCMYLWMGPQPRKARKSSAPKSVVVDKQASVDENKKEEEVVTPTNTCSDYIMTFTLERKPSEGDYGLQKIAHLDMSNLTLDQVREMVNEVVDRVK